MFDELYNVSLQQGIEPNDYWNYTYGEIIDILTAKKKQQTEEAKLQVLYNYQTAYLTASFVAKSLNNGQIPSINELFPDLFQEELGQQEQEDNSWIIYKEQLRDYAENHNRRLAK